MANHTLSFAPNTLLPSPNPLVIQNGDSVTIQFPPFPNNDPWGYISISASWTAPPDPIATGGGTIKVGS